MPPTCRQCAAPYLEHAGFGTERVEAALRERFPDDPIMAEETATPEDFQNVIAAFEAGKIPTNKIITRTMPFAEAGPAMAAWLTWLKSRLVLPVEPGDEDAEGDEAEVTSVEDIPEYAQYVDPQYAQQLMSESMPEEDLPPAIKKAMDQD